MFKKLGTIGLALAITLAVASSAVADLKFYGGTMTGRIIINPVQNFATGSDSATQNQGLSANDAMSIATDTMYAVVADNEYLIRDVSGALGKGFSQRQVTAANASEGVTSYYKSSGIKTTTGSVTITAFDQAILNGNSGNIQYDAAGTNPSLTFTSVTQSTRDTAPVAGPLMAQTNNETAVMASPGNPTNPLSMITTGNATGVVVVGSGIASSTAQNMEFSSLLRI